MTPKTVKPNGRGASAPQAATPKKKPAKKKAAKKRPAASTSSNISYIRNLHGAAGGARLDLSDDTRIQLEPRGQIGDTAIVSEEHRTDPLYQRNIGYLFEELTEEQGRDVIGKQGINAQSSRQSVMQHLTNERGEKYKGDVQVEASLEEQSIKVADISDGPATRYTDGHQDTITRSIVEPPQQVQVPGSRPVPGSNLMPEGLTEEQTVAYLQTPTEQRPAFLAQLQGTGMSEAEQAAAYRESLTVKVQPTVRG